MVKIVIRGHRPNCGQFHFHTRTLCLLWKLSVYSGVSTAFLNKKGHCLNSMLIVESFFIRTVFTLQSPGRRRRSSSFSPHMPVLSPKRLKIVDEAEMVKERKPRDRKHSTSKRISLSSRLQHIVGFLL